MQAEILIQASVTLTVDQKELLIEIGKERCIDCQQVQQYETVAGTMIDAMRDPTPEGFGKVEQAFWKCSATLTEHGNAPWYALNPANEDLVLRSYAECAALAARELASLLRGVLDQPLCQRSECHADGART